MKKLSMYKFALMAILTLTMTVGDAFARSSGSRSSSSRSSSSRSSGGFGRSSSASKSRVTKPKKAYTPSKATTGNSKKYKPSTGTSKNTAAKRTSGGFGVKKLDTKSAAYTKTNARIKKDFPASNKQYTDIKSAKADLGGKMANKKYTYNSSASAMASRPANIPRSYGGYTTSYNINTGGYGYYGVGHVWMPYLATHMIINDAMMHSYAPAVYNQHVVVHRSNRSNGIILGVSIGLVLLFVFVVVAVTSD